MKVLIVDDSPDIAELLGEIIADMGYQTTVVENGLKALDALKQEVFDMALVDWKMPEMSGLELIKAIRANSKFDTMKIIMITGMTDLEDVTCALENGANEYLMKPFSQEMVVDKLRLCGFDLGAQQDSL